MGYDLYNGEDGVVVAPGRTRTAVEPPRLLPGQVRRGRITVSTTGAFREFLYNPATIRRSRGWGWGRQQPMGRSNPIYQGGSGNDEQVSFDLFIDGERGRLPARKTGQNVPLDISDELAFYMSLTYPVDDQPLATPPRFVVTLGTVLRAQVVMDTVNEEILAFTADGAPLRAMLSLSMFVDVELSVTAREVYSQGDEAADAANPDKWSF